MEQNTINIGDRIEHNIYGLGFVSSQSKMGRGAFFIVFDGRKDILWIESSNIRKVE